MPVLCKSGVAEQILTNTKLPTPTPKLYNTSPTPSPRTVQSKQLSNKTQQIELIAKYAKLFKTAAHEES